ncbi:branched-chain amino acid ABC transporter permease [Pseudoprimorskyibacter insulae]|uniref:High-affinity branched-chain amino acid transport system permease protein LivH n=1 Tax=Pseudoprimorskyibacter insulae TaxID=1695997 RepID=A0A2R8AY35_9RHOB|nr:branched-chain amino acid ABC transporter permease [Pseudoprimorskyibacter insulae]SPF80943.1 High-affinity branched-chain amino acid transport system permease protein LivH [Pseudoprimorskyibacter insulae]
MDLFLNILVDGVAYGMILFMIAVGLSVTMGLMRVVNLAHGGFALIGGTLAHWAAQDLGLGYWAGLAVALAGTMAIALPLERVIYRRIYGFGELQQVLATIGLTFLMIATVNLWQGSALLTIGLPEGLNRVVDLGFRTLPAHRLAVIAAGALVALGLWALLDKTRFGIRLRAAVDNRDIASSLGIDTGLIYMATFALGAGLAALGGVLGAELLPIDAYYPLRYMVLFLIVVAVGGMGSIAGSFAAALGLGLLETAARYLAPDLATLTFLGLVTLLLVIRPNGLLGRV